MSLYNDLFYAPEVNLLLSPENTLARMLRVEAVLAQSQAKSGIIPQETAEVIRACCDVKFIDLDRLKSEIPLGANAAIPLVKQLIGIVKNNNFEASKYVHLGATSQDIMDTALVLSIKTYIEWLETKLKKLMTALHQLAEKHTDSLMIGRTLLQQAKPITFGLKVAGWLQGMIDTQARLREAKPRVLQIQLGGAVGSANQFLSKGVRLHFAENLGLQYRPPWQSNRGNLMEWASNLGILSGQLGKIARDISLLMQTEIAEVFEGAVKGKGGSSTMPHKRNPVTCSVLVANAQRVPHLVSSLMSAMIQEHERSAGMWHAEWEPLEQIMALTAGSVEKGIDLIENLEVDTQRMRENLEVTQGLIYAENVSLALAPEMGKGNAHEWVEKACQTAIKEKRHLKDVIKDSTIPLPNLDALFDPTNSIGNTKEIIHEILKNYENQF